MTDVADIPSSRLPKVRKLDVERPWAWLRAGWHDFLAAPGPCLAYGFILALAGMILTAAIWFLEVFYLVLPLAAGFMLLGPILAGGLYEIARCLEKGEAVEFSNVLSAWRRNPAQIGLMGLALMLFLLAWIRIATLIFAIFFSDNPPRPEREFIIDVFLSVESLPFLVTGTIVGGILAILVFALSAISIPMLLDKPVNVFAAIATSMNAVRENFWPMALWAWLIVFFTAGGIVIGYVGLIVTLPLIGLATWHAYRDLVDWDSGS